VVEIHVAKWCVVCYGRRTMDFRGITSNYSASGQIDGLTDGSAGSVRLTLQSSRVKIRQQINSDSHTDSFMSGSEYINRWLNFWYTLSVLDQTMNGRLYSCDMQSSLKLACHCKTYRKIRLTIPLRIEEEELHINQAHPLFSTPVLLTRPTVTLFLP